MTRPCGPTLAAAKAVYRPAWAPASITVMPGRSRARTARQSRGSCVPQNIRRCTSSLRSNTNSAPKMVAVRTPACGPKASSKRRLPLNWHARTHAHMASVMAGSLTQLEVTKTTPLVDGGREPPPQGGQGKDGVGQHGEVVVDVADAVPRGVVAGDGAGRQPQQLDSGHRRRDQNR